MAEKKNFYDNYCMMQYTDHDLIIKFREGQETAFFEIYERYHKKIFNYLYNMGIKRENILDVTQDVFLELFRSIPTYREEMKFTAYLFRITRNVCVSHIRKVSKMNSQKSIEARHEKDPNYEISDIRFEPAALIENKIIEEKINCFLLTLPERERSCLALKIFEEMSVPEIALVLKVPERTTRRITQQSFFRLTRFLESLDIRGMP